MSSNAGCLIGVHGTTPIAQSPVQGPFATCWLELKAVTVVFHHVPSCFVSFLVITRSDYFFSSSMFSSKFVSPVSCSTPD